ncbi:hypothetical protein F443_10142 [Phytophthora nicotianae P1569]|uniref:Uncharacterized protein n=3 Tax=Phytophthora nicotianae TaxID=4792 RepID=V9F483_PHYNI|nr:hypothetical protein F443_10142 [Phytophthora nicotianae P1569]
MSMREFKRRIVERLTHQECSRRNETDSVDTTSSSTAEPVANVMASGTSCNRVSATPTGDGDVRVEVWRSLSGGNDECLKYEDHHAANGR